MLKGHSEFKTKSEEADQNFEATFLVLMLSLSKKARIQRSLRGGGGGVSEQRLKFDLWLLAWEWM